MEFSFVSIICNTMFTISRWIIVNGNSALILGCILRHSHEIWMIKKIKELGSKWCINYSPAAIYYQTHICFDTLTKHSEIMNDLLKVLGFVVYCTL